MSITVILVGALVALVAAHRSWRQHRSRSVTLAVWEPAPLSWEPVLELPRQPADETIDRVADEIIAWIERSRRGEIPAVVADFLDQQGPTTLRRRPSTEVRARTDHARMLARAPSAAHAQAVPIDRWRRVPADELDDMALEGDTVLEAGWRRFG